MQAVIIHPWSWLEAIYVSIPKSGNGNYLKAKRSISLTLFLLKTVQRIADMVKDPVPSDPLRLKQHEQFKMRSVETARYDVETAHYDGNSINIFIYRKR